MNSDSVSFSFVLALLTCCIQLYMTHPFLFPSSVYFIPTLILSLHLLAPWCRIHFPLSFMSHCLCLLLILLLLFYCYELSLSVSLLGLVSISIACAILSLAYSSYACQSDNFHLRPSNLGNRCASQLWEIWRRFEPILHIRGEPLAIQLGLQHTF